VPTFGIPCPPPDPQLVADAINVSLPLTISITQQVVKPLTDILLVQQTILDRLTTIIARPCKSKQNSNTNLLNQSLDLLAKAVQTVIDENQQVLNIVQALTAPGAIGEPGPTYLNLQNQLAVALTQTQGAINVSASAQSQGSNANQVQGQTAASGGGVVGVPAETGGEPTPQTQPGAPQPLVPPRPAGGVKVKGDTDSQPDLPPPEFQQGEPPPQQAGDELGETPVQEEPQPQQVKGQQLAPEVLDFKGIPAPGSEEFCLEADKLLGFFSIQGLVLVEWANTATDFDWGAGIDDALAPAAGDGAIFNAIKLGIKQLFDVIAQAGRTVVASVKAAIRGMYVFQSRVFQKQNFPALLGLSAIKSAISTLHNLEVGTDAAAWLVARLDLNLRKLEEVIDLLIDYAAPMSPPSIGEAIEAWLKNRISETRLRCILQLHNLDPDMMEPFYNARGELISSREAIQAVRRTGGGPLQEDIALRERGFTDPGQRMAFRLLYDELPTVGDWLEFLRKNVFDGEYVRDYRLMEGFEEKFWPIAGGQLQAIGITKERAALHYAAHWIQPAPVELREFVWRLRPGAPGIDKTFTPEDYERLLVEKDVAPYMRERYKEILYRVPALGYLRDLYRNHIINDEDLKGYHRDLGYTEKDSERFVAVDRLVRYQMRANQFHGWTPSAIGKAVAAGQMLPGTAETILTFQGATADEIRETLERGVADWNYSILTRARSRLLSSTITTVRQSLQLGTITEQQATASLTAIGWPAATASGIAALETVAARNARTRHVVTQLRSSFHRGEITSQYAGESLAQLGIVPAAIQSYVVAWTLEQTPNRKRRTAASIAKDVADGFLDTTQAYVQLRNLGYEDAAARLYFVDAAQQQVHTQAAVRAAGKLGGRAATAELASLARSVSGLSKRVVAQLQKFEPPSKLLKWMCLKIVTPAYVTQRLRLYGWDDGSIEKNIRGAQLNKIACFPDFSIYSVPPSDPVPVHGAYNSTSGEVIDEGKYTGNDTTTTANGSTPKTNG
jgi:hypothetical protein